ncbi:hypothetical protein BDZ94DRAFT_57539 [Collybia nuda]|uniref:RING-type domain-containing protein n=1 Tax=Collybia nuda TaxID=64659 RepID=A0A9P5YBR3_9AGAR|nr:hypothetical protein BDZ94DRAFT_57539 [Collybia nuda]
MSTRQATPGPSNGTSLQPQQTHSKKRAMSEGDVDGNSTTSQKRMKKDSNAAEVAYSHGGPHNKDKDKKKRKKKKRKLSVVLAATIEPDIPRARSKSRPMSATATVQPPVCASPSDTKPGADIAMSEAVNGAPRMDDEDDASPATGFADKGKGKAIELCGEPKSSTPSTSIEPAEAQIARLKKELEVQSLLLQRHQTHLNYTHQSLTCQICLDLLHKPFAMAPCGHVTCHGCLVRWFTASSGDIPALRVVGGMELSHINKRKTCPICRTVVTERPVEVWSIKSMVGNIVRSGLVELAAPPPTTGDDVPTQGPNGNPDPWRNIFRPASRPRHHFDFFGALPPVNADENAPRGDLAEMGMYDAEDGGIYRCIDCMNEIWDGICTGCRRVYAGHQPADDADDALSEDDDAGSRHILGGTHRRQRMLRDFINMLARGGPAALDPEEDESDLEFGGGGIFEDDDDDDDDNDDGDDDNPDIPGAIADQHRELERAFRGSPTAGLLPAGFRMFADFTDEESETHGDSDEEAGIAMINDEEGYESSFVDDGDDDIDANQSRFAGRVHRQRRRSDSTSRINLPDSGSGSDLIVLDDGDTSDRGIAVEDVVRETERDARLGTRRADRRDAPRRGRNRAIILDSLDGSDTSDTAIVRGPTRHRARGGRRRRERP